MCITSPSQNLHAIVGLDKMAITPTTLLIPNTATETVTTEYSTPTKSIIQDNNSIYSKDSEFICTPTPPIPTSVSITSTYVAEKAYYIDSSNLDTYPLLPPRSPTKHTPLWPLYPPSIENSNSQESPSLLPLSPLLLPPTPPPSSSSSCFIPSTPIQSPLFNLNGTPGNSKGYLVVFGGACHSTEVSLSLYSVRHSDMCIIIRHIMYNVDAILIIMHATNYCLIFTMQW